MDTVLINMMKMERKAIFDAALRLIHDGKFQAVSLAEVGYYANLSERTTRYAFENKEKLLEDLSAEVLCMIHEVCVRTIEDWRPFEKVFYDTWISLYEFYVKRPRVLAFVEQSGRLTKSRDTFMERLLAPLTDFFQINKINSGKMPPSSVAAFFHNNAMAAARLHGHPDLLPAQPQLHFIVQILWTGLTAPPLDEDNTFLRIAN